MIATGGDDNRMIITLINVYFVDVVNQSSNRQQQQVRLNFLRSFSQQISGHTCQITGLFCHYTTKQGLFVFWLIYLLNQSIDRFICHFILCLFIHSLLIYIFYIYILLDVKFTNENDYRNLISISIDQQMICWRIHIADNDDDDGDKIPNTKIIESNKTIDSIISIDRQLISIADVSSFCRLFIDHWNNNNDNNKRFVFTLLLDTFCFWFLFFYNFQHWSNRNIKLADLWWWISIDTYEWQKNRSILIE